MRSTRWLWIALVFLFAAPIIPTSSAGQSGGKTLITQAKTAGGTAAKKISVPRGSTTYKLTVKDADLVSDDTLFEDDWEPIGDHSSISVQFGWLCVGGDVVGASGSSGESCAELVFCVEFNNGNPTASVRAGCACCGGK